MYKYISVIILLALLSSCRVSKSDDSSINTNMIVDQTSNDGEKAVIEFEESTYDFGKISQGEKVMHTFKFTNTGNAPLVLGSVKPTCGCTVAKDWPKQPIQPGDGAEISVEFNSEGRKGKQSKGINVISNTKPATTVLYISGEVIAPN